MGTVTVEPGQVNADNPVDPGGSRSGGLENDWRGRCRADGRLRVEDAKAIRPAGFLSRYMSQKFLSRLCLRLFGKPGAVSSQAVEAIIRVLPGKPKPLP
jgi:hypothetical protein